MNSNPDVAIVLCTQSRSVMNHRDGGGGLVCVALVNYFSSLCLDLSNTKGPFTLARHDGSGGSSHLAPVPLKLAQQQWSKAAQAAHPRSSLRERRATWCSLARTAPEETSGCACLRVGVDNRTITTAGPQVEKLETAHWPLVPFSTTSSFFDPAFPETLNEANKTCLRF